MSRVHVLTMKFPCLQEMPPTEPVQQGDEGDWDTVGEVAGSRSPAPTVEELLAQMERQPLVAHGSTEPAAAATEEAAVAEAREEAGSCRGGTGRRRQYPRRPNRDGSLVELVSVDSSRVVLDVVVVLY
jgi:hypothetical protein